MYEIPTIFSNDFDSFDAGRPAQFSAIPRILTSVDNDRTVRVDCFVLYGFTPVLEWGVK